MQTHKLSVGHFVQNTLNIRRQNTLNLDVKASDSIFNNRNWHCLYSKITTIYFNGFALRAHSNCQANG